MMNELPSSLSDFDPRNYEPVTYVGRNLGIGTAYSWVTLLNFTGEGFFDSASIVSESATAATLYLQVIVDGVAKFLSTSQVITAIGQGVAIAQKDSILAYDNAPRIACGIPGAPLKAVSPLVSYPYIAGGAYDCLIPERIPFKTNLLIQMQASASTTVCAKFDYLKKV